MDDLVQPRIGSDAIWQTLNALRDVGGEELSKNVIEAADLKDLLDQNQQEMVPRNIFLSLVRSIENLLPRSQVDLVAVSSGRKTGEVLVRQYIPHMAQKLLHTLPSQVAGPLLLQALEKHAWTFAGSAKVYHQPGPPLQLVIESNPMAIWGCLWQCALLETVFRELISTDARVWHMACCADGKPACIYMIEI